ncbi:MAG: hypothetical protein AB7K04_16655 [Pseudorhodoplanes sp.]
MSSTSARTTSKSRTTIWIAVGLGLLLLAVANGHLVYVAMTSQPDCVDHVRQGEAGGAQSQLSAARSSCSPR